MTTPTPHHSVFTRRMLFLTPNSIRALKAIAATIAVLVIGTRYVYWSWTDWLQVLSDDVKRKQYDTYGMSGERFAGARPGAQGPFPGAAYSGRPALCHVFLRCLYHTSASCLVFWCISVCLCFCPAKSSLQKQSCYWETQDWVVVIK